MKIAGLMVAVALVTAVVTGAVMRRTEVPPRVVTPDATVQEIMEGLVDPSAKVVFESVGVISNASGTVERAPANDEEWEAVARHAMLLAEAANLLELQGRHVERPGPQERPHEERSPELPPAEIERRIAGDHAAWLQHVGELRTAAMQAYRAASGRSVEGLFDVGSELDVACENCHRAYWYNAEDGVKIRR